MKLKFLLFIAFCCNVIVASAQTQILRKIDTLPSTKGVFSYGEFLGELNGTLFYIGRTDAGPRAVRAVTNLGNPIILLNNIADFDNIKDCNIIKIESNDNGFYETLYEDNPLSKVKSVYLKIFEFLNFCK